MSKMQVPREIVCGSHRYRVVCDKETTQRLKDENNNGELNNRTLEVMINLYRPKSQRNEALIHEALHIADKVFRHGDEELKEDQISGLAEGMAQILQGWGLEFDWPDVSY